MKKIKLKILVVAGEYKETDLILEIALHSFWKMPEDNDAMLVKISLTWLNSGKEELSSDGISHTFQLSDLLNIAAKTTPMPEDTSPTKAEVVTTTSSADES